MTNKSQRSYEEAI